MDYAHGRGVGGVVVTWEQQIEIQTDASNVESRNIYVCMYVCTVKLLKVANQLCYALFYLM